MLANITEESTKTDGRKIGLTLNLEERDEEGVKLNGEGWGVAVKIILGGWGGCVGILPCRSSISLSVEGAVLFLLAGTSEAARGCAGLDRSAVKAGTEFPAWG